MSALAPLLGAKRTVSPKGLAALIYDGYALIALLDRFELSIAKQSSVPLRNGLCGRMLTARGSNDRR